MMRSRYFFNSQIGVELCTFSHDFPQQLTADGPISPLKRSDMGQSSFRTIQTCAAEVSEKTSGNSFQRQRFDLKCGNCTIFDIKKKKELNHID